MRGDHIYVNRLGGVYEHHGIDCGDGTVIHYTSKRLLEPNVVMRTPLAEFTKEDELQIRSYETFFEQLEGPQGWIEQSNNALNTLVDQAFGLANEDIDIDWSEDAVVERAKSRLGDRRFDIVFHNCEHFATWCKTGISRSDQILAIWKRSLSGVEYYRRRSKAVGRALADLPHRLG